MHLRCSLALATAANVSNVLAQQLFTSQTDTFNSSANISTAAASAAGISELVTHNAQIALNFERSNWATGSVADDPFYHVPSNSSNAPPGSVLKIEFNSTVTQFALPPDTALSRILFMSETFNGSAVPASAYILWPYLPRTQPDGRFQVVGFAHGTCGSFGECGPSHLRPFQYQFGATYTLAMQGYVVVAPDYTGLGVNRTADGTPIVLQYLVNPAAANDIFYAVEAAQTAFSTLSDQFVVVGHSQGGGAAWAAAERQVSRPVKGYLGTVAGSPATNFTELVGGAGTTAPDILLVANGLSSVFPTFSLSDWLTDTGIKLLNLATQLQGCTGVTSQLFSNATLALPNYQDNFYFNAFAKLASTGGKAISGPMLVLQGTADPTVPSIVTDQVVNITCEAFPESQIEYIIYADVTHSKSLSQPQL